MPAGFDVGRLGADPERDRDLADAHPGVLVGEQGANAGEEPASLTVELVGADAVDRGPHQCQRRSFLRLSYATAIVCA